MRATILVAGDDENVRDIVAWCLRREGYRVVTAADSAEALRSSARTSVDLFVLDLNMPALDGAAAVATIRANARSRGVPILIVTGRPQDAPTALRWFRPGRRIGPVRRRTGSGGRAIADRTARPLRSQSGLTL